MIRLATTDDWEDIKAWRDAHMATMEKRMTVPRGTGLQKGLEDAIWVVWDRHGMAVAALSFAQDDDFRVRWVFDLYGAPGCALAGLQLVKAFEKFCDDTGYEMRGDTDPENTHYLKIVLARGYELTAISYRRRPQQGTSEIQTEEEKHEVGV